MSKSPFQSWLAVLERRWSLTVFLVEWLALFAIAWLFWSVMFWAAPGSIPPRTAAIAISGLYATIALYGRVLRTTGCRRCTSPLPFLRQEVGRRHLPDQEDCTELEYGGEEYGMILMQVYCRVIRADMVTYQCRHCGQMWEERVQLSSPGYHLVRRTEIRK